MQEKEYRCTRCGAEAAAPTGSEISVAHSMLFQPELWEQQAAYTEPTSSGNECTYVKFVNVRDPKLYAEIRHYRD